MPEEQEQKFEGAKGAKLHPFIDEFINDETAGRRYSFSNLMHLKGEKKNLPKHGLFGKLPVPEHLEDCDRWSVFSDSGMSDASCKTDTSINSVVTTGLPGYSLLNTGMRKNFSTNDMAALKHHQTRQAQAPTKLPSNMLLSWLSHQNHHQKHAIGEMHHHKDTTIAQLETPVAKPSPVQEKIKSKFGMRDLNALAPTCF